MKETGCHGFCKEGPLVSISPKDLFYTRVKPGDVEEIVEKTLIQGEVVERLLYSDNGTQYQILLPFPFIKCNRRLPLGI